MKHNYAAIMAGGIGSRFWPGSRTSKPKQFLDILGTGSSLIRVTYERFLEICPPENIFIVTNKIYKDLVKEHLPEISDNQILLEPSRNNTAPCIAYAAHKIKAIDKDAKIVVAPSDHIILKSAKFKEVVNKGLDYCDKEDALVTIGIEPTRPDTGYGYIQYEENSNTPLKKVKRFTEKPDLETAKGFVASGDFVWNAGIFIWHVNSILNAISKFQPTISEILSKGDDLYNTTEEQAFIDENYPQTPSISIDYAVMENADNIYTIPADLDWSDLGTWSSLHAVVDKDESENALFVDSLNIENSKNNLIRLPKDKLAVIKGLEDFIVIDEGDVLLIWPKSDEQAIKQATKELKEKGLERYL